MSQDNIPERFLQRIKQAKKPKLIEELDLSNDWNTNDSQKLTRIPDAVFELTHLKVLKLSGNQLSTLPDSLSNLSNLTRLDLSLNQLKKIPSWLAENKLEIQIENRFASNCINLFGNPIEEPPLEVVKQGNEYIRNYYSQIATQGKDYLYEAKMLIVGEGGAGKTTLAHKIKDTDCPLPTIDDRTKGITINTHSFSVPAQNRTETRPFQLNVWDFGGQEIYHATHRFFLSRRSLYVLVADNREDNTDFNYWLNIIELFAGDSPIIIVLNEKDDVQRIINTSELRSRYPYSLKELLSVNFKTHEETDSEKRQQRLKLIRQLISHIEHYAAHLPHIGEPVPALWVDIRQAVENDSRNYIYFEQFFQICYDQGITDKRDIVTLLSYFHDLGIVLHFADNPLLRERVILKPAWATNAVYRIFDNDLIIAKQGRFTRADCSALWSDTQYNYMHDVLIALMKNFHLVYEIGNTDNLIAPQMLPQDTPNYTWDDTNNSLMQFRYDLFMPKGILWQFIVTMYRYIKNHSWVWRNGVILERDGTSAEVRENLFERRIYLRFSGTSIAEFRAIIADRLDEISQSYHKLEYDKMVPCLCSSCRSSPQPYFFQFSVLKKRQAQRKKPTIECLVSGEDVPLNLLLEGFELPHITDKPLDDNREIKPEPNKPMKTIKIFLASSSELEKERDEFEIFIRRKNDNFRQDGIYLELVRWENFIDAMSQTRLQDEYNKAVADCDIFVSLFHTKVGKYTEEEFLKALETFKANGKPLIYTYFKDEAVNLRKITPNIVSLINFKQKLSDLGHFYTNYADINALKYKFSEQLIKVLPQLTGISPSKIEQHIGNENQNLTKIEQHFYGNVGSAPGNIEGDQNLKDTNIKGDYYEQKGNFGIGHMSGGEIKGNAKVAGVINEAEKPNLADAATEIQQLLEQLSETYPTTTSREKNIVVGEAVDQIESNPTLKAKVINALKAGGTEAFKEAVDHPLVNILVATIEGWQDAE